MLKIFLHQLLRLLFGKLREVYFLVLQNENGHFPAVVFVVKLALALYLVKLVVLHHHGNDRLVEVEVALLYSDCVNEVFLRRLVFRAKVFDLLERCLVALSQLRDHFVLVIDFFLHVLKVALHHLKLFFSLLLLLLLLFLLKLEFLLLEHHFAVGVRGLFFLLLERMASRDELLFHLLHQQLHIVFLLPLKLDGLVLRGQLLVHLLFVFVERLNGDHSLPEVNVLLPFARRDDVLKLALVLRHVLAHLLEKGLRVATSSVLEHAQRFFEFLNLVRVFSEERVFWVFINLRLVLDVLRS